MHHWTGAVSSRVMEHAALVGAQGEQYPMGRRRDASFRRK